MDVRLLYNEASFKLKRSVLLLCFCLFFVPSIQAIRPTMEVCSSKSNFDINIQQVDTTPYTPKAGQDVDFTFRVFTWVDISEATGIMIETSLEEVQPNRTSTEISHGGPFPLCSITTCPIRRISYFTFTTRHKMRSTWGFTRLTVDLKNHDSSLWACVKMYFFVNP
ncbi:uncharacterized protein [Spinacia oleracea]|uniref:MD-2-related lipid-recognition domain-containing protein n=1 Tax=Spinacia oleracea TaxID=3562 RepID=A0A9R0JMK4_SPIOL|nr:uncharacterized protein LOC110779606 [Spinacia oleracea]